MFPEDPTHEEVQKALREARWPAFKADAERFVDQVLTPAITAAEGERQERLIIARTALEKVILEQDYDVEGEVNDGDEDEELQRRTELEVGTDPHPPGDSGGS
jgi:hypothetical protein